MVAIRLPAYRRDRFVNRAPELKMVREAVTRLLEGGETVPLVFTGERGTGKTWLLWHLRDMLAEEPFRDRADVAYFDLRAILTEHRDDQEPLRFAYYLLFRLADLSGRTRRELGITAAEVSYNVMQAVAGQEKPLVVLVDHVFEVADERWEPVRTVERYVLGPLATLANVLLVLTGRGRPYPFASPELRIDAKWVELKPFDRDTTEEQVEKLDPEAAARAAEIHALSGGNPLVSAIVCREPEREEALEKAVAALVEAVPEEERDKATVLLMALSPLRIVHEAFVGPMLTTYDRSMGDYPSHEAVRLLLRWAFLNWDTHKHLYVLDEQVRRVVENYLQVTKEEVWRSLHEKAVEIFSKWAEASPVLKEELAYHEQVLKGNGNLLNPPSQPSSPDGLPHDQQVLKANYEPVCPSSEPEGFGRSPAQGGAMTRQTTEEFRAARRTPHLVGRKRELAGVEAALDARGTPYLLYICGPGGIGKTRFVEEVLSGCSHRPGFRVAAEIVDLYHTRTHTVEGLTRELKRVLARDRGEFQRFEKDYNRLQGLFMTGVPTDVDIHEQRLRVGDAFIADLKDLARKHRVVLALDTAERLLPQADPTAEPLGLGQEYPHVWAWLMERFLPALVEIQDIVVLLAGRPDPALVLKDIQGIAGLEGEAVTLQGLDEGEVEAYVEEMVRAAEAEQDEETARRLQILDAGRRKALYRVLCEVDKKGEPFGARPIMLALVLDHLISAGRLSPKLREVLRHPEQATQVNRREVEADLVAGFMELASPLDQAIQALAWLRKGANPELLARAANLRRDGDWDVETAKQWLDEIRALRLSFVKTRPADDRVFLHDEMYDLFQRHMLDPVTRPWERGKMWDRIHDYYRQQMRSLRGEIRRQYLPTAASISPKVFQAIFEKRAALQDAMVEDAHYALYLQGDLEQGFTQYLLYAEEALGAYDESLDMMLGAELLSTVEQERTYARQESEQASQDQVRRYWQERVKRLEALWEERIVPDAAVRWVKRLVQRGRYADALRLAEALGGEQRDLLGPHPLVRVDLAAWRGVTYAYEGRYGEAEKTLNQALNELKAMGQDSAAWRQLLFGRVLNNLGYVARHQGQVLRASRVYEEALTYWRNIGLALEQANTLNNLAYALAQQGQFSNARRLARDALGLRQELGPQGPVVLSLTTQVEIDVLAGNYAEAERLAERALALAQSIEFPRGEGLGALALTSVYRFLADPEQGETPEARWGLLEKTLRRANEAQHIFEEKEEWEGLFRARYGRALALREQCRLTRAGAIRKWTPEELHNARREADRRLKEIALEARERERWDLYLDAEMGRAWLHYYLQEDMDGYLKDLDEDIRKWVPDYLIERGRWPGVTEGRVLGVFAQLGRYHVLRGLVALDKAEKGGRAKHAERLEEAGTEFALAFEYDRHISEEFRDLHRAMAVVYDRLRGFNIDELLAVFGGVRAAWETRMPQWGGPGNIRHYTDLLFWRLLEQHFGTHEALQSLARGF